MTITEEAVPVKEQNLKYKSGLLQSNHENANSHTQKDLSVYSKFLTLYTRDSESQVYCSIEEKQDCQIECQWASFMELLKKVEPTKATISENIVEYHIPIEIANRFTGGLSVPVKVSEYHKNGESQIRGCITTADDSNEFDDWFIFHILDQARLNLSEQKATESLFHDLFAEYFEKNFKNTTMNDEWLSGGRDYFIERVKYFTSRNAKVECVLPAFPCKSSNFDKVKGQIPDKGEELALRRLIKVTLDVGRIYPPGMKIWIISDGHVFSDCIGVDDDVVNSYTAKLHQLYEKLAIPGLDAIGFCGLNDLFFNGAAATKFHPQMIDEVIIEHFTGSKICAVSDVSRAILMKGCDTDDGRLRKQISIEGHPRLNLYRGFSRFMMEDLSLLPSFKSASKKSFKKLASKIAFNMIKRNDAYSNLVELIFPHHIRLSIHAHTNRGPKFGVKVISSEQCRIVKSFSDGKEPTFEDLLHIPTPWHNCVARLESEGFVMTKSRIVKEALDSGTYEGEWIETCLEMGEGGHFLLRRPKQTE